MSSGRREGGDISAIFVHAGAGFHSFQNEEIHLKACNDAAKVAMAVLKNGGTAVDAVEIAIKLLEDREITNSGYGSNLTIGGTVECDATIVDHYGRSGAAGAVSQIKNPISLARLILDASTKPLSLQRVPPNLLVGMGATDFAYDHGMPVLPPDFLVSPAARERWYRWKNDLDISDKREYDQFNTHIPTGFSSPPYWEPCGSNSPGTLIAPSPRFSPLPSPSPNLTEPYPFGGDTTVRVSGPKSPSSGNLDPASFDNIADATSSDPRKLAPGYMDKIAKAREVGKLPQGNDGSSEFEIDSITSSISSLQLPSVLPGPPSVSTRYRPISTTPNGLPSDAETVEGNSLPFGEKIKHHMVDASSHAEDRRDNNDKITDTVGAIAVDSYGNIAAGSSSGGIGMKHRGRTGPAALVGIGTAVIPTDPKDPEKACVATVTSGTGEHMATTMAAHTCATQLYSCMQKGESGEFEEVAEDEAMGEMIQRYFMDHPGVKTSHCQAAIGIMAVKKTRDGVFLYFGHNTDSFALASMSENDKKPACVMSRSTGNGSIAQGGRAARFKRYRPIPVPPA